MHVSSQYQYYVMLGSAHKKTENQIEHQIRKTTWMIFAK